MSEETALGRLLRRHRSASALTQEDLAELAGISARTISDIERGLRTTAYRDTVERLAGALGLEGEDRAEFQAIARAKRGPVVSRMSLVGVEASPSESAVSPRNSRA